MLTLSDRLEAVLSEHLGDYSQTLRREKVAEILPAVLAVLEAALAPLEAVRPLADAATWGPWRRTGGPDAEVRTFDGLYIAGCGPRGLNGSDRDADFIVAAANTVRRMLAVHDAPGSAPAEPPTEEVEWGVSYDYDTRPWVLPAADEAAARAIVAGTDLDMPPTVVVRTVTRSAWRPCADPDAPRG